MDYIYFRITGEHLDLPSMIENIGIKPEKLYHKGERYQTRPIGDIPAEEKEYDFDGFMSMIECDFKDTEKQLERLIEQLYRKKEFLRNLSEQAESMTVWVNLYPETYQQNLHISPKSMGMLAYMHISLDITSMNLTALTD